MSVWLLIIIPILAIALMMIFFDKKKIAWWEYAVLLGASILVIFLCKIAIETSQFSDTEYWSELAYEVEYEGAYDEYIHETCTREYSCGTNDDGSTKYCTETYDCSYVEDYGPAWRIKSKEGGSIRISESEYNRIKRKWGNEKKTGSHSESYSYDDGIYGSFWLNRRELIECMVTMHTYENRVQAAHTVFDFQEVTEEDVKNYGLFEYPKIYDNYKQKHILGITGDKTREVAEKNMQILNAQLGPRKQLKAFILLFKNKSKTAGELQEAYWSGGNKNEFVVAIGVDDNDNIQWVHPFSWAEKSIVKVNAREFLLEQEKLNLEELSNFLYDDLESNFVRKQFEEFNYLTVEPSTTSMWVSAIILIIVCGGIVWWSVVNEFDDEIMTKKKFGRY